MIIKKYLVRNMNEGILRIKQDLGKDAIIISQRKVRKKGFWGFFSPKLIEVTATSEGLKGKFSEKFKSTKEPDSVINPTLNKINKLISSEQNNGFKTSKELNNFTVIDKIEKSDEKLKQEILDMKNLLVDIQKNVNSDHNIEKPIEKVLNNYKEYLLSLDISKENVESILKNININENDKEINLEIIKNKLKNKISVVEPKEGVLVFVGPTGVGKTTTIAKLAGRYALFYKKKVGLITIDTYRIGAVEQLRTYAEIMNIPFKVVVNLKEMNEAIASMNDCDVILVDTTGRSSKNLMQIQELKAFVDKTQSENIYLLLSATTKSRDIDAIVEGYGVLDFNNLIVTKLDETTTYGSILDILVKSDSPLAYITSGQNVPEDIKNINKEELLQLILGESSL